MGEHIDGVECPRPHGLERAQEFQNGFPPVGDHRIITQETAQLHMLLRDQERDIGVLHGGLAVDHGQGQDAVADPVRHDDEFFCHTFRTTVAQTPAVVNIYYGENAPARRGTLVW